MSDTVSMYTEIGKQLHAAYVKAGGYVRPTWEGLSPAEQQFWEQVAMLYCAGLTEGSILGVSTVADDSSGGDSKDKPPPTEPPDS